MGEEERELSEIAEEEDDTEEELRVRDGVAGSWTRVRRGPGLVRSRAGSVCPSDVDNSKKELRVGDGVAVSCARVGSGLGLEGSRSRSVCLSNSDSLEQIPISSLSERLGSLRAHGMSFRESTVWRGIIVVFFFFWGVLGDLDG